VTHQLPYMLLICSRRAVDQLSLQFLTHSWFSQIDHDGVFLVNLVTIIFVPAFHGIITNGQLFPIIPINYSLPVGNIHASSLFWVGLLIMGCFANIFSADFKHKMTPSGYRWLPSQSEHQRCQPCVV
jgi:hypothetical protein